MRLYSFLKHSIRELLLVHQIHHQILLYIYLPHVLYTKVSKNKLQASPTLLPKYIETTDYVDTWLYFCTILPGLTRLFCSVCVNCITTSAHLIRSTIHHKTSKGESYLGRYIDIRYLKAEPNCLVPLLIIIMLKLSQICKIFSISKNYL